MTNSSKYPVEKEQLALMFVSKTTQGELDEWVERTIDMHRAQADALAWRRDRGGWWSRNWIPVLFFVILVGGMLAIGLVNGWS